MMIQLLILSWCAGPLSTPGARSTTDSESEKRQMPRLEKWSAESPAADWAEMKDPTFGGKRSSYHSFPQNFVGEFQTQ